MSDDLQQRVIKVIGEVIERDPDTITPQLSLRGELGLDSLKQMTLFILLEDEFQKSMPPEDVTGVVTVQDVIDFIRLKLA